VALVRTTQKTPFFIVTAVKTSNLTLNSVLQPGACLPPGFDEDMLGVGGNSLYVTLKKCYFVLNTE
jgi:hypothetical protein